MKITTWIFCVFYIFSLKMNILKIFPPKVKTKFIMGENYYFQIVCSHQGRRKKFTFMIFLLNYININEWNTLYDCEMIFILHKFQYSHFYNELYTVLYSYIFHIMDKWIILPLINLVSSQNVKISFFIFP